MNTSLYEDKHPETSMKGLGYKDAQTAKKTLKLINKKPIIYQKQVVNTMYNRAKYHKYRTKDMLEAMKVFKSWLDKNNT
jgi:hypothetical protein